MKSHGFWGLQQCLRTGVVMVGLLMVGHAQAGLFDDEEARKAILEMRQRIETQKTDVEKRLTEEARRSAEENAQLRRSLADLQNQIELMRADLAKMRGQDEQIARDLSDVQRRQKDTTQAFDDRLRKLEPMRMTFEGREILIDAAEKRDFDAALAVFRKGEFANSQGLWIDFLGRYPTTGFKPSALFWLGNAQYAVKNYKDALSSFRSLVAQTPDHQRVPETLLAIANCQLEMKDSKGARKTLEELTAGYPSSEASQAAKDRLTRLR